MHEPHTDGRGKPQPLGFRPNLFVMSLIVIAVMTAFVFSGLLFTGDRCDLMGCGDNWTYLGPHAFFMDASIHSGDFPLWNPLILCGKPFAANPQAAAFYPPNLIRSLAVVRPEPIDTHISLIVMTLLHLLMGAAATLALARRHGLSHAASLAAAAVFLLNANVVGRFLLHWNIVCMAAWLPVILLLVRHAVTAQSIRAALGPMALAGIAFGFSALIGFVQITFYMGVAVAGYAVLCGWLMGRGPTEERGPRRMVAGLGVAAAVGAVAVAVSAAMWLPAAELARLNVRANDARASYELEPELGHPPLDTAEYLVAYPGAEHLMSLHGPGTVAVLLAVAGLVYGRRREALAFGLL
ncbi:MAG: hypothetical protein JXR94_08475, partial [Candidatus Hydrogenedentes bacterium]|nr:hypothetical protein [Candidatus Hydrogenedentota bacterium]